LLGGSVGDLLDGEGVVEGALAVEQVACAVVGHYYCFLILAEPSYMP
jgi:hypothetical protein